MGAYQPRKPRRGTLGPNQQGETHAPPQPQAGETELEQDERGEDAEQTVDPQAEQALREAAMGEDGEEPDDEAGRLDRND